MQIKNKSKLNSLEIVRGLAAFTVVINHLIGKTAYFQEHSNFITQLIGTWGTEAVLIFFVLSGIVIGISQDRNPKNKIQFLINRIIRIWPIMLLSIVITVFNNFIFLNEQTSWKIIWGNVFFLGTLQSYIIPVLNNNPVLWSLSFEMFFYIVFSLCIGKNQNLKMNIWLVIALISSIVYALNIHFDLSILNHLIATLSYSLLWLLGYFTYQYKHRFRIDKKTAILFFSMLPLVSRIHFSTNYYDILQHSLFSLTTLPAFICILNKSEKNSKNISISYFGIWYTLMTIVLIIFSKSLIINRILYFSLPITTYVLIYLYKIQRYKVSENFLNKTKNILVFMGSISYALYCLHFPILILFNHLIPVIWILIPTYFLIIISLTYTIEQKLQPKLSFVNKNNLS